MKVPVFQTGANIRAPHWEDDYCGKCDHHDRYHFEDGQGKVFCRWDGKCVCAESAAAAGWAARKSS